MALSECKNLIDKNGRELVKHGTTAFPVACYYDDLGREGVAWHWHDELEAAIITSGCAIVAAGNKKYTIHKGEGFFINAGILHGAWDIDMTGCRFHSLVFHPRFISGSIDSVFYQNYVNPLEQHNGMESVHFKPDIPWHRAAMEAIETAWQSCVEENVGYEFEVRAALSKLIFLLCSHSPAVPRKINPKAERDGERIKIMLQYIHDSFGSEMNVKDIADSALISESECLRCFRATIGTTPIQYLKQYRIQRAAQLLLETQEKVAEIAAKCGFSDISYFTKTFREIKGCVPTKYRLAHETKTTEES